MKKKKVIIITGSCLIVVLTIIFSFVFKKDKTEYVTVELQKQNLTQTVSEIGAVKASQEIGLNFSQSGKLQTLNVKVGDEVKTGDILAELDYSSVLIQKKEAEAALSIAKTNQEKIIKGAVYEDVAVLEAQVKQAETAYNSAKDSQDKTKKLVEENINQAQKNLDDLKVSNYQVPMSVKQAVESAKVNLTNIEKTAQQTLTNNQSSLLSSLDYNFSVARSSLDAIKRILDDDDLENVFSVKNYTYKIETERTYNQSVEKLSQIENNISIAKTNPTASNIKTASDNLATFLREVFSVLNNCFSALENSVISSSLSRASLDAFKANVNTNKDLINAAISSNQTNYFAYNNSILSYDTSVSSAQDAVKQAEVALNDAILQATNALSSAKTNGNQQLSSAQSQVDAAYKNYEVVRLQLTKLKSSASSDDLKLAQAQVDQATASLNLIQKQIENNIIKAPIDGRITEVNSEVGEQVVSATPVINLLADNNFEIEVYISESDISKIKVGNKANITFDAFDDDYKINGQVYFIDPAATSISDVIYYKIKINFSEDEISKNNFIIKSGMTANVDIIADYKENVFAVSSRAILVRDNGEQYIRVLNDETVSEITVTTGINGDQSKVEIFSEELQEGSLIITSTVTK